MKLPRFILISSIFVTIVIPLFYLMKGIISNEPINWYEVGVGILFTAIVTVLIYFANYSTLKFLEKKYPWNKNVEKRLIIEVVWSTFNASVIISVVFFTFNVITGLHNDWGPQLFESIIIANIVNVIIMSLIEGLNFFNAWKKSLIQAEVLQKETIRSQYETLKNQVNPHFLFNSLNSLTSLIHTDPEKAEQFVGEFSKVYRYLLEMKDKTVVTLKEELDFLNSYFFLQKIRFGDNLQIKYDLDADQLNSFVAPVSLQILAENAIKHNIISNDKPLEIWIYNEDDILVMKNIFQQREEDIKSTGIGLKNIKDKYFIISNKEPKFYINGSFYYAKIPLIKED